MFSPACQPIFVEPFGTRRVVPKKRIFESPEGMIPSLMCSCGWVDILQLLEGWMKVATMSEHDVLPQIPDVIEEILTVIGPFP
jgi:hypothetical protein